MRTRFPLSYPARLAIIAVTAILLFLGWYAVAANYDYGALAGTYSFHGDGVSSTLLLRADRSFHQEVTKNGSVKKADGKWYRSGQSGVNFSKEFLRVPGAKTFTEEFGMAYGNEDDSEFCGRFDKIAGVYPILALNANAPGPTFDRKLFH
jgi:hypothetical protein